MDARTSQVIAFLKTQQNKLQAKLDRLTTTYLNPTASDGEIGTPAFIEETTRQIALMSELNRTIFDLKTEIRELESGRPIGCGTLAEEALEYL